MNYNLKVDLERINGKFVSNVEVSCVGRASRKRVVSDTLENALGDVKAVIDEQLGHVQGYHARSAIPPAPESDPEADKASPKAKAKAEKATAKAV